MKIAEEVNMDREYIEMMNHIENDTEFEHLPSESELEQLKDVKDRISIVTFEAGTRLIVKDESEILIPRKLREHMLKITEEWMLRQCHRKIF